MNVKTEPRWDPQSTPSFLRINHASRLLMRQFEQQLRPLGFGFAYLPVAIALEENSGLLQKDLAVRAHVEQPTMALLLARMERDGLVRKEPHPDDKRATRITLTPKARQRLPKAKQRLAVVAKRVTNGFSAAERDQFLSLLQRAVKNLDAQ